MATPEENDILGFTDDDGGFGGGDDIFGGDPLPPEPEKKAEAPAEPEKAETEEPAATTTEAAETPAEEPTTEEPVTEEPPAEEPAAEEKPPAPPKRRAPPRKAPPKPAAPAAAKTEEPPPTTDAKPTKPKGKKPKGKKPSKRAKKPLTPVQRTLRLAKRRGGSDTLPDIKALFKNKTGTKMKISDIAIFIEAPTEESLKVIAEQCPKKNRVNLSTNIDRNRVVTVGGQLIHSNRMYQPIQVARIEEDGALECTSGRHRLAFLAMAYGPDQVVTVDVEDMTINEARDAVVFANQTRTTKALEKAEHAVLQAVCGDVDADQDEMYSKTAITKVKVRKYAVYSVLERNYPLALAFKVSLTQSRKGGGLTTVSNFEEFVSSSVKWAKGMPRKEFDAQLEAGVKFLNALAAALQKLPGFEPSQHMAAMPLRAVGKYYRDRNAIAGDAMTIVDKLSERMVALGDIARYKPDETYDAITEAMKQ
jgi:hypothetical protein